MADKPLTLVGELLWTPDKQYEAAKALPEWAAFHRLCGQRGLHFDFPEKDGRGYRMAAFRIEKLPSGGWRPFILHMGQGRTVMDAMVAGYRGSGRAFAETDAMLERGLMGAPPDDEFATLAPSPPPTAAEPVDEFEGLL